MSNLLYIPNGYTYGNLSSINFNDFNPSIGFHQTYIPSAWGWNSSNTPGLSYNQRTLLNDIQDANQKGDTNKSKVLSAILTYGPTLADMIATIILATKGVSIKNPNQLSEEDARRLMLELNGNFSPENVKKYSLSSGGETKIFGIPLGTIAGIFGGILLWQIFAQNQPKGKR